MNAAVQIRPMQPDDFAILAGWMVTIPLWQRYHLTSEQAVRQFASAYDKGDILLAADRQANIASGFAWCVPEGAFGRSAYLRLIGVHPDCEGSGIGARLLNAVEEAASQRTNALFLLVSDFNVDAQRFYQRHGYQQAGAIGDYVVAGITELIFWKRLIPA